MQNIETIKSGVGATNVVLASFRVWCVYMMTTGVLLAIMPDVLLGFFGFPPTEDNWIRVFGVLVFNVGLVYIPMMKPPLHVGFIAWTIYARYCFAAATALFMLVGLFPISLLIFSFVDAANATWTWFGLRKMKRAQ